jgi:hypothetical protein
MCVLCCKTQECGLKLSWQADAAVHDHSDDEAMRKHVRQVRMHACRAHTAMHHYVLLRCAICIGYKLFGSIRASMLQTALHCILRVLVLVCSLYIVQNACVIL